MLSRSRFPWPPVPSKVPTTEEKLEAVSRELLDHREAIAILTEEMGTLKGHLRALEAERYQ